MVSSTKREIESGSVLPQRDLATGIRLSEVVDAGLRLEASAYAIEARRALEQLKATGRPLDSLFAPNGVCRKAHNAFRFKRHFVDKERGAPFLSSSDIISLYPEPKGYLSAKKTKKLDELRTAIWDVLISCSGTIGNIGLTSPRIEGWTLSQDAIRLSAPTSETAGFVTAYLRGRLGRLQLRSATYGSVVQHIEPEHLGRVQVPRFPPQQRDAWGATMLQAALWRDEANDLIDQAQEKLHKALDLPKLGTPKPHAPITNTIKASNLNLRFEGSFHDPMASQAISNLRASGLPLTTLSDPKIVSEIRPITKFRKRLYVNEGGIPLLSSKQLFQIAPVDIKRLAKGAHEKDLKEIALEENTILVSRSGTIGKVQIAPKYMTGWAGSEHAIRIFGASDVRAGFIFCWLSSDYGQVLIKRNQYGSVILEIDKDMLSSVLVPLPPEKIEQEIGELILRANELRDQAWRTEQKAIAEIEKAAVSPPQPMRVKDVD